MRRCLIDVISYTSENPVFDRTKLSDNPAQRRGQFPGRRIQILFQNPSLVRELLLRRLQLLVQSTYEFVLLSQRFGYKHGLTAFPERLGRNDSERLPDYRTRTITSEKHAICGYFSSSSSDQFIF